MKMNKVKLPELNEELAEFMGIIAGDGYLFKKNNRGFGIVGNPKKDMPYFLKIQKMAKNLFNKDIKIFERSRGLRTVVYSNNIFDFLTKEYGLPFGKGKCCRIFIPEKIIKNTKLTNSFIRGIVDTDGSIFMSNKPRSPNYPSIEITTTSKILAFQIKEHLVKQRFRVAKIWSCKSKNKLTVYRIPLNGKQNVRSWLDKIGFSNPYKLEIAINSLK